MHCAPRSSWMRLPDRASNALPGRARLTAPLEFLPVAQALSCQARWATGARAVVHGAAPNPKTVIPECFA